MISRPVRVVLACATAAAAAMLLLQGAYDGSHGPGAYCTVTYPDGSTGQGQFGPYGQCLPLRP